MTDLHAPGAVLLVSCYELGHQPLGLAAPLAFLERAGYSPSTLDLAVERLDPERVGRAALVGISVPMHTALRLGMRAAEQIRRLNPGCHLCFYGLYATLNSGYLLGGAANSIAGGEYEEALVGLARALEQDVPLPVEGITWKEVSPGPAAPVLRRLSFPLPVRGSLPPLDRYARLEWNGGERLAGYVEASRGCKHLCRHCPIPPVYGGRFFVVPRETVLADIRNLVEAGARHITFGDPDFLNGPAHALRIVRDVHAGFPGLTFDFTAKVEHLLNYPAVVRELGTLGCVFLVSAVESLSDTVLANLDKGHTRADVRAALALVREAGITMRPSLLPFTPWSTLADYLDLLDWIDGEDLVDCVDPVHLTIRLLVPPGSSLLSSPAMHPYLGPLDEGSLSHRWDHPEPRMDRLQQAVSARVEAAARDGEDPRVTFRGICDLARSEVGRRGESAVSLGLPPPRAGLRTPTHRAPRLTEAWFC